MSHVSIQEVPGYHKLIFLTDSGMCINPDLEQKKQILINVLDFMRRLGYEKPAVAALCAIETVNPNMSETLDAHELKRMVDEGIIENCVFEGPISYDVAMPEAARIKGIQQSLSGRFRCISGTKFTGRESSWEKSGIYSARKNGRINTRRKSTYRPNFTKLNR